MKPRIEKKLSKKLAVILSNIRGFKPSDIWVDSEYSNERSPIYYSFQNKGALTSKQKRENWQREGVRVDNMPSVGGELDYWGEGTDHSSVFEAAIEILVWEMFPITEFDVESGRGGYPLVNTRLTGKKVIELARRYAKEQK